MWVTNLIDARISQRGPKNIEELIDNHLEKELTDNILEERVSRVIYGNSPEDVGLNMDYYLHKDSDLSQRNPGNIEEISEARVLQLIDNHLAFSLTDDKLQEQIRTLLDGNSPEDLGMDMDYYLHEDSDLGSYLELDEFASKDDVHEIIERATLTISVS